MCFGVFVQVNENSYHAKSKPTGYIIQESGCWEWVGSRSKAGYGTTWSNGKDVLAHRMMYERAKGAIPKGLSIDHLCRNRCCVNPDHLEAVTHRENVLRGQAPTAVLFRAGRCNRGHDYAPENTYIRPDRGRRMCLECRRINFRAYKKRQAEHKP